MTNKPTLKEDSCGSLGTIRGSDQGARRPHWLIRGSESREIRTGRRRGYVGDVPMTRLGGKLVSGESLLELDFLIVTDAFECDFVDIIAQPFSTDIMAGTRKRTWTPDFLIRRRTGFDELVEVKHLNWLYHTDLAKRALARARCQAMAAVARERNCTFRLITEEEIRVQPRLINAKLIHRHCSPLAPKADLIRAIFALTHLPDDSRVCALAEVLGDFEAQALVLAIRLERAGHIRLDRHSQYTRQSRFSKIL
jgi:hypothetical protein